MGQSIESWKVHEHWMLWEKATILVAANYSQKLCGLIELLHERKGILFTIMQQLYLSPNFPSYVRLARYS